MPELGLRVTEETPEGLVFQRIRQQYGHFARPRKARVDSESSKIIVPIAAEIPMRIVDHSRNRTRIAWIALGEVAQAKLTATPLTLLEIPSAPSFQKAARERYREITRSVEADMVAAAPLEFGSLTFPEFYLQTLKLLISELEEHYDDGISEERLLQLAKQTRQHEYLLTAGYARVAEGVDGRRLMPTERFVAMRGQHDDPEKFAMQLFGVVFSTNYDAITARLRPLKSFVRSALTYYSACYEFGELFKAQLRDLERRYQSIYRVGPRQLASFRHTYIRDLCNHKILSRRGDEISGYPQIYDGFQARAEGKVPVTVRLPAEG